MRGINQPQSVNIDVFFFLLIGDNRLEKYIEPATGGSTSPPFRVHVLFFFLAKIKTTLQLLL